MIVNTQMLPIINYNTTVMLVDDNLPFLNALSLELSNNGAVIEESEPTEAIKTLVDRDTIYAHADDFRRTLDDDIDSAESVKLLDFTMMFTLLLNQQRIPDISVVVVDYAMPSMNGIEFCEQIADLPVKKIMLTGEASAELAVEAFNQGIIDAFFQKDANNVAASLLKKINELKLKYFLDFSNSLRLGYTTLQKCKEYNETIARWIKKHDIVEYTLIDEFGSILGLNSSSVPRYVYVQPDFILEAYAEQAELFGLADEFVDALKSKTQLLYFLNEQADVTTEAWDRFAHNVSAEICADGNNYYIHHV